MNGRGFKNKQKYVFHHGRLTYVVSKLGTQVLLSSPVLLSMVFKRHGTFLMMIHVHLSASHLWSSVVSDQINMLSL